MSGKQSSMPLNPTRKEVESTFPVGSERLAAKLEQSNDPLDRAEGRALRARSVPPEMMRHWLLWLNTQLEHAGFAKHKRDGSWQYFPDEFTAVMQEISQEMQPEMGDLLKWDTVYRWLRGQNLPTMQGAYGLALALGLHPASVYRQAFLISDASYAALMGYKAGMLLKTAQLQRVIDSYAGVDEDVVAALIEPLREAEATCRQMQRDLEMSDEEFIRFAQSLDELGKERMRRETINDRTPIEPLVASPSFQAFLHELEETDETGAIRQTRPYEPPTNAQQEQPGPRRRRHRDS